MYNFPHSTAMVWVSQPGPAPPLDFASLRFDLGCRIIAVGKTPFSLPADGRLVTGRIE